MDTAQTVYPVRGSYTEGQCGAIGQHGDAVGHNCNKLQQPPCQRNLLQGYIGRL